MGGVGVDGNLRNGCYVSAQFKNLHYLSFALANSSRELLKMIRKFILLSRFKVLEGTTDFSKILTVLIWVFFTERLRVFKSAHYTGEFVQLVIKLRRRQLLP